MLRFQARDLVRDLQALLRDRYRDSDGGIAIVKELLQNADDAGARNLILAFVEQSTPVEGLNPLCFRSGVLVINDAPFEAKHERAFTSFSTSSKDNEEGQIGRFGIGRKSLFHWSEVVFYIGCDSKGGLRGGVINPWAEQHVDEENGNRYVWRDSRNPTWLNWTTKSCEGDIIQQRIQHVLGDSFNKPWFGVWLPSRTPEDDGRLLTKNSTSSDTLPLSPERLDKVARLMPQLANVTCVKVFGRLPFGAVAVPIAQIERQGTSLGRPGPQFRAGHRTATGVVSVSLTLPGRAPKSWQLPYDIEEYMHETKAMLELKKHANWPTEPPEDINDPDALATPAKAAPHGGTTIISAANPGESGRKGVMHIHQAIFLPLSGPSATEQCHIDAEVDVSVFLHGYQFPDSGRQQVDGHPDLMKLEPDSAPGIRARWNVLIKEHATFPTVLPTLAKSLKRHSPSVSRAVLEAFNRTALVREHRKDITSKHQLAVGPAMPQPELIPSTRLCVGIPESSDDKLPEALREVAKEMAGRFAIVWQDSPGLLTTGQPERWKSTDFCAFRERCQRYFAERPKAWLHWFTSWSQSVESSAADELGLLALELYRAATAHKDAKKILGDAIWTSFARSFLRGKTASLWMSPKALEYLGTLKAPDGSSFATTWPVIALRTTLLPEGREAPRLPSALVIQAIAALTEEAEDDGRSEFVAALLKTTSLNEVIQDKSVAAKRFISVWSTRHGTRALTLGELSGLTNRGLAFQHKGTVQPEAMAKALAGALAGAPEVALVRDEGIANALSLPTIARDAIATAIRRNIVNDDPNARQDLLERLLVSRSAGNVDASSASPDFIHAVRRLLAGPELPPREQNTPLWLCQALPTIVVTAIYPAPWRVVANPLELWINAQLGQDWKRKLCLRDIDVETIAQQIRLLLDTPSEMSRVYDVLGNDGRVALGVLLADRRYREIWRRLAVHRSSTGAWTSLDEPELKFYRSGSLCIPIELRQSAILIEAAQDDVYNSVLADTLETFGVDQLIYLAVDDRQWKLVAEHLPEDANNLREDSSSKLKERPWLPLACGEFVAPAKIIALSDELSRLTRALPLQPTAHVLLNGIHSEVRSHRAWPRIARYLLSGSEAVKALLDDLVSIPNGPERLRFRGTQVVGAKGLDAAFAHDPVFAWWQVIERTYPQLAGQKLDLVEGQCSRERARELLAITSHADDGTELSKESIDWISFVIKHLHGDDGLVSMEDVKARKLVDHNGHLRDTMALARGTNALPPRNRLHQSLDGYFPSPPVPHHAADASSNTGTTLQEWMKPWDDAGTSRGLLAYLVAIFANGGEKALVGLVEKLAPFESVASLLGALIDACGVEGEHAINVRSRTNGVQFRFVCVRPGEKHEFVSIAGTKFTASVRPHESLVVDRMDHTDGVHHTRGARVVRLHQLDPGLDPVDRHRLLHRTIKDLFAGIYGPEPKKQFSSLLDKGVDELQQLAVAQNLLIDSLPYSLRQLRVHSTQPRLKRCLDNLDRTRHNLEQLLVRRKEMKRSSLVIDIDTERRALRTLIEKDGVLARDILTALRSRITEYQYQPEQVLFELAQNADDAYSQMQESGRAGEVRAVEIVVKPSSPRNLSFWHGGRPIGLCYRSDDRDRGWDRDLLNMLALGFSEKGDTETGRFGLGFKSVYLISDKPHVRSENLCFEIRAGLLPFPAKPVNPSRNGGTEFNLPFRDTVGWEAVVGRFARLCGMLLVTSQAINAIRITTPQSQLNASALPRVLASDDRESVEVVLLDVASLACELEPGEPDVAGRWLFIREHFHGDVSTKGARKALGFRIEHGAFTPIDNRLPSIWVTVPTREQRQLGFVMSGPFGIDVGRSRLADESEESKEVAHDLECLGRAGLRLLDSAVIGNSEHVREVFGPNASIDLVATSLFDTITSSLGLSERHWEHEQIRGLLGKNFLNEMALIPTVDGKRCLEKEILRTLDEELEAPAVREVMRKYFGLAGVLISVGVRNRVKSLGYKSEWTTMSVVDALANTVPVGSHLDADCARRLLKLTEIKDRLKVETWRGLSEHVATLIVVSQGGGQVQVGLVLLPGVGSVGDEEQLIVRFAPAQRVLKDGSEELARCVLRFRGPPVLDVSTIAEWAKNSESLAAREGVVTYLLGGKHKDELKRTLREERVPWLTLKLVMEVGARLHFPKPDLDGVCVSLGLARIENHTTQALTPPKLPVATSSLDNIFDWWRDNSSSQQQRYMRMVYPQPWQNASQLGEFLKDGNRRAWSLLCMLAICQRLGRVRPEQNRVFIENHARWLDVLENPESTPSQWLELIDAWGESAIASEGYAHWLGLFPTLRRLWRVSRDLFELLSTTPPPELSPAHIFDFHSNPALTGTGIHLPNLMRAFGKRGRIWLCRELVRLGVWDFHPAQRYYVPWKLACDIVRVPEGAESETIAAALDIHLGDPLPFGAAFDLPFDLLRFDSDLRDELLEYDGDVDEDDDFGDDDEALDGGM